MLKFVNAHMGAHVRVFTEGQSSICFLDSLTLTFQSVLRFHRELLSLDSRRVLISGIALELLLLSPSICQVDL